MCVRSGAVDQIWKLTFFLSFSSLVQSDLQAKPEIIQKGVKKRDTPVIHRGVP